MATVQEESRYQKIVDVYIAEGRGMPIRDLAILVRDAGIFTPEERGTLELQAIEDICRKALTGRSVITGLPIALPGRKRNGISTWYQLEIMPEDEFLAHIQDCSKQLEGDYERLLEKVDFFQKRFKYRPVIPELRQLEMIP